MSIEPRQKLLSESHVLRFDDIAYALADRMQAVDSRAVVHRLDGDIDHLLLDEFQDTSLLQWDVLRPFVAALDSRRDTSFFCVGDVKQAIYGWRGGVAALFDKVQAEVHDVQTGMLNVSRRSAPAIMTAVNQVFQNLDAASRSGRCGRHRHRMAVVVSRTLDGAEHASWIRAPGNGHCTDGRPTTDRRPQR